MDNNLIFLVLIALSVFNIFNFRIKAKCFSGDVGSISIAFVIVFLLGLLIFKSKDISWIILLGLYGVDAILTIIHRIMLKENILKPHRKHMYQIRTNELKIPHLVVSGGYCVIQALIVVGFIVTEFRYLYAVGVIAFFSVVYVLFMRRFFRLQKTPCGI